jgi:1-deoxy-D-xylulose-5-phosphate reductoisomerase
MMNKGLEVIEAHWLFNAGAEQIEVVVHPQSVIHSMVEYVDGSIIAQLGNPDMRTPIAHALDYPDRIDSGAARLDFFQLGALTFEKPDLGRFPCVALAYQALRVGGSAPIVLNAANEVAVEQFLHGNLPFNRIAHLIEHVLARVGALPVGRLEDVLAADRLARETARERLAIA